MSNGFNYAELTAPQTTEWTREATAAYDRSLSRPPAFDTGKPAKRSRSYDVRNMHGKVWKRASSPRGRT